MRHTLMAMIASALCVFLLPLAASAKNEPEIFSKGGAAIRGYDPVAYFEAGEPVRGSKEHSLEWHGAEWHFSSAENLAKFEADPTAFAPQYGGYCAFAMSRGSYASTDPEAWRVVDGKLYLNYNKGIQKKWLKDRDANIVKADANWKEFWAAR